MNTLLKRQLDKCGIDLSDNGSISENYMKLFDLVNESYNDFDEDKMLLERSIDISSREYMEHIERIKELQISLVQNEKLAGVGQLSAGIAHEINNPLGFIRSNMETLSKYISRILELYTLSDKYINMNSDEDSTALLNEIKELSQKNKINAIYSDMPDLISETLDGVFRISEIVKSLLSFSRKIEANELEDFDINKGVTDTLTIAQNEIKYIASVNRDFGEVPMVKAKHGEVCQVILNILINAVHAIKQIGIKGEIGIRTFADKQYINCEISDNGGGIPAEYINKIFEPFFTTKPVGTGTGLGLSISHDIIVNKHKGKLNVISEVGKGTAFTISLPIEPPL